MDNEMQALGPLEGHVGLGGLPSGGSVKKKTDNEMEGITPHALWDCKNACSSAGSLNPKPIRAQAQAFGAQRVSLSAQRGVSAQPCTCVLWV